MDRKPAAYMVPLCLVLGFSPIAFLVGLVVPDGAEFFAVSGVGIFIAAILLIGAWSVLGTGRYLTRLTASHLAGIVIAACFLFAVILRSTGIGSGPWRFVFDVKVDTIKYDSGNDGRREIIHHNGGAVILPITNDGKLILLKQFRYPLQEVMIGLVFGFVSCI